MNNNNTKDKLLAQFQNSGYTIIPDCFFDLGLDPLEVLLLAAAHRYSQSGKTLILSASAAAKKYGKAQNTVKKILKKLVELNLLNKISGNAKNMTPNQYYLNYDVLQTYVKNCPRSSPALGQTLPKPTSSTAVDLRQELPTYNTFNNRLDNTFVAQKENAQMSDGLVQEEKNTSQTVEQHNQPSTVKLPVPSHKKRKQPDDIEKQFDMFWQEYPKKRDRKKCFVKWKKLKPDAELFAVIMKSLRAWVQSDDWQKDGGQYIPYPSTWLNGERWDDELPQRAAPPPVNAIPRREYEMTEEEKDRLRAEMDKED